MSEQAPRKRGRPPEAAAQQARPRTPHEMNIDVWERFMAHLRLFAAASSHAGIEEMDKRAKEMVAILDHCRGVQ